MSKMKEFIYEREYRGLDKGARLFITKNPVPQNLNVKALLATLPEFNRMKDSEARSAWLDEQLELDHRDAWVDNQMTLEAY